MNIRRIGFTAAAILASLPSAAGAAPGKVSLDACLRAFESKLASPGAEGGNYKVNFAKDVDMSAYAYADAPDFTFELAAVNPRSGVIEKRAVCSATRGGRILQFAERPAPKR